MYNQSITIYGMLCDDPKVQTGSDGSESVELIVKVQIDPCTIRAGEPWKAWYQCRSSNKHIVNFCQLYLRKGKYVTVQGPAHIYLARNNDLSFALNEKGEPILKREMDIWDLRSESPFLQQNDTENKQEEQRPRLTEEEKAEKERLQKEKTEEALRRIREWDEERIRRGEPLPF